MPVTRRPVAALASPTGEALLNRLIAEWQQPVPGAQQPIIIEETAGHNLPTHLYVIWDDWAPLGSIERSEVIMDAYGQIHGRGAGTSVTVAMGLTPLEADGLGIRYR
jgi:hypothetical protein